MTPLGVTARLRGGQVVLPWGPMGLDSLLGYAIALKHRLPPLVTGLPIPPLPEPLPVAQSPCGRVYLASFSESAMETNETRYANRRFPAREALRLTEMKRVDVSAGPQKSYRIPYTASHLVGDQLTWWCVGDADGIRALLGLIHHVGKRRAIDYGRVARWEVDPVEDPWPGFPVVRAGRPLRPLPLNWPGLTDYARALRVLTPPYYDRTREEPCAVAP